MNELDQNFLPTFFVCFGSVLCQKVVILFIDDKFLIFYDFKLYFYVKKTC